MVEEATDFTESLNDRLDGYDREMGLRFVTATVDEVRAEMPVTPKQHQPYGLVHGGVYCGIVETLCSVGAALNAAQHGRTAVGLENSTSFIHAVRSGTLHAKAVPLTRGRRTQVWAAEIRGDDGKLAAHGKVRMLLLEAGREVAGATVTVAGDDASVAADPPNDQDEPEQ